MNGPAAESATVAYGAEGIRVHLRLTRTGGTYTGEASNDGTTWTTIGTATPGGLADTQDVGVFMTAANGWTGTRGIADFEHFTVSRHPSTPRG